MPSRLKRFHHSGQSHFVTFCCYHRRCLVWDRREPPSLRKSPGTRASEPQAFAFMGYVVMPEHVHLLLSEPERETLAEAMKSLKQGVSRTVRASGGLAVEQLSSLRDRH